MGRRKPLPPPRSARLTTEELTGLPIRGPGRPPISHTTTHPCRRCGAPAEPGKQCAECRERVARRRREGLAS